MQVTLKETERIDDLQLKGLKLIQDKTGFCFGIDAVLLANFAKVKNNAKVVDLGTGTPTNSLQTRAQMVDMLSRDEFVNVINQFGTSCHVGLGVLCRRCRKREDGR